MKKLKMHTPDLTEEKSYAPSMRMSFDRRSLPR